MIYWLSIVSSVFSYCALMFILDLYAKRRPNIKQLLFPHERYGSLGIVGVVFRTFCLISPGVVFKIYSEVQKGAMWAMGSGLKFDSKGWNCFGFNPRVMFNRAGEIFILNFHWVLVFLIVAASLVVLTRVFASPAKIQSIVSADPNDTLGSADDFGVQTNEEVFTQTDVPNITGILLVSSETHKDVWWGVFPVLASFAAFVLFNISYITYIIPRYVVNSGFFLIFFTLLILPLALKESRVRNCIYGLVFALFSLQTFWTLDPLSKWVFGSTSFGKHKMLQIDSIGEAQGNGFVYSATFTVLDKLFNRMQNAMPLTPTSTIITWNADPGYAWHTMGGIYINSESLNRTIDPRKAFSYNIIHAGNITAANAPATAFYVYMPWLAQFSKETDELNLLRLLYNISEANEVNYLGYSLRFYRLTRLVQ
jgi:hypothetical protein